MIKRFLLILVALLWCFNANADYVDFEELNYSVNDLTNKGYKITFVNQNEDKQFYYTLEKDNDVVLCRVIVAAEKTYCYRP